jgi:NTP-dependent ternary system trypsin peptidase co-occuring protein
MTVIRITTVLFTLMLCPAVLPARSEKAHVSDQAQTTDAQSISDKDVVAIQDVVKQIKQALAEAQSKLKTQNVFRIKTVTLTLQTVATKKIGGTFKLWIITFGHEVQKETTQQIVVQLGRPATPTSALQATIDEELVNAIVTASQGVKNSDVGPFPLQPQKLTIELSFVITRDTTAGGSFAVTPVSLDLKGDFKNQATHKMSLEFDTQYTPAEKPKP